jgi:hypothetical protein
MKLRHAAVLALTGWTLAVPLSPTASREVMASRERADAAQARQWEMLGTYATLGDCEAAAMRRINQTRQPIPKDDPLYDAQSLEDGPPQCFQFEPFPPVSK